MNCNQCQEAAKGIGCTVVGVCGKSPELSALMDTFIYSLVHLSALAVEAKKNAIHMPEVDIFVMEGLFATITNANFSEEAFVSRIKQSMAYQQAYQSQFTQKGVKIPSTVKFLMVETKEEMIQMALKVALHQMKDEDIRSIRELILFGLKGFSAYLSHADKLGYQKEELFDTLHEIMASLIDDTLTLDDYIALTLKLGAAGVEAMALLDTANTTTYGNPEISTVEIGVGSRPGILITGHDLHDLHQLLEQTKDQGIDIYTHSEMLAAHYYPELKKYEHLKGNYGNAWHLQTKEFETFNGPIIFTTNCLVPPRHHATYTNRAYTTGNTGYDGFKEIPTLADGTKDFSAVIEQAKTCLPPTAIEAGQIIGGFAHHQVLSLADTIIEAINKGDIKNFVVMAGCDGRHKEREYYTDFAKCLPTSSVILTAGCAKYRYNKLDLGDINGVPRLLDAGQCNDSYSLAMIALKLKEILGVEDINDLPIIYNIAWYEQKAVIVLLALLSLGVKNIHLGPTLPAFLSPNITDFLVKTFKIGGITNVDEDLKKFFLV